MDERLEKALTFSNYRATIENRRVTVTRRFETMRIVHKNNGLFFADETTIAFVNMLINDGHTDAILLDRNDNPIEIDDLPGFKEELMNVYFTAINEYSTQMKKLSKARSVKKAMDW